MVLPVARLFRAQVWRPSGCGGTREAGRTVCRGESGSALSGGYAPDLARVEGSLIIDDPGDC